MSQDTYRAFEVTGVREFDLVDRPLDGPAPGHVRVRVEACGVCHSDVTGTTVDGGYAEYAYARDSGLVRIPDGMDPLDAAPLLCAGLAPRGRLVVVGAAPDPISVKTADLIFGGRSITGNLTGTSIENEDNLRFSQERGVRPMTEAFPLKDAPAAYEHMMSGRARFRVVLQTESSASDRRQP